MVAASFAIVRLHAKLRTPGSTAGNAQHCLRRHPFAGWMTRGVSTLRLAGWVRHCLLGAACGGGTTRQRRKKIQL